MATYALAHRIDALMSTLATVIGHERVRSAVRAIRRRGRILVPFSMTLCVFSFGATIEEGGRLLIVGTTTVAMLIILVLGARVLRIRMSLKKAAAMIAAREGRTDISAPQMWKDFPVGESMRCAVNELRKMEREVVLAHVDMSGRAYSAFGELPCFPSVSKEAFARRDRYNIDVVLLDEVVLLRKDYRGDIASCLREWFHMEPLAGKANVPIVRKVDVERAVLYMDFICGRTMLEILRDHGALMRDSDVVNDPTFKGLTAEERQRKLDERGTKLLTKCFSEEFFRELDDLIHAVHCCRLSDLDIRFANVIVDGNGKPWMIDFHETKIIPRWAEFLFRLKRAGDYRNYARVFGRQLA